MTSDEIKTLALANGFKLKPQPDGSEDLNPYVYDFARALMQQISKGCILVPVEPTEEILDAAYYAHSAGDAGVPFEFTNWDAHFSAMYSALIKAAQESK